MADEEKTLDTTLQKAIDNSSESMVKVTFKSSAATTSDKQAANALAHAISNGTTGLEANRTSTTGDREILIEETEALATSIANAKEL